MMIDSEYVGAWRIAEMSTWDKDYIDLVAPGHLTVKSNGTGTFVFGVVDAELDCRMEQAGDRERLAFSFAGFDEGDEVNGRGWAEVAGNKMNGWFAFHGGDDSTFKARKKKKTT